MQRPLENRQVRDLIAARLQAAKSSLAHASALLYGKYVLAQAAANQEAVHPQTRELMAGALDEFEEALRELERAAQLVDPVARTVRHQPDAGAE